MEAVRNDRKLSAEALLQEARSVIERRTPAEALELQHAGALIIDIRSDTARVRDGIVPGSIQVPRTVLEWRADDSSRWQNPHLTSCEGPLLVLCDHGWSSSLAAAMLLRLGHDGAGDVIGGFEAWQAAGLPVVASPPLSDDAGELPGMRPPDGEPGSG